MGPAPLYGAAKLLTSRAVANAKKKKKKLMTEICSITDSAGWTTIFQTPAIGQEEG